VKIVAPFRGEFGIKLRYHVPRVHAIEGPKLVIHEEGEEALYPNASERMTVERAIDFARRDTFAGDRAFIKAMRREFPESEWIETKAGMPETRFVPVPFSEPTAPVQPFDVLLCPRRRKYGAEKNWPHWFQLVGLIESVDLVCAAAGAPDSSRYIPGIQYSWDRSSWGSRFLDTTLAFMREAKVVIATDSGLAHLAVLCGKPLVMIAADGGRVAPGAVYGDFGKQTHERYWPVRMEEYYAKANHLGSPIEFLPDGWDDIGGVARAAIRLVGGA